MVDVSAECRPLYRPRYLPIVGRYVGQYLGWYIGRYVDRHISVDISAECPPICRPTYRSTLGRYVDRYIGQESVDMLTDISVEGCTKYTWSWIFGKMHHRIPFLVALRSFASVDSLSIFLAINPCRPCSITWDNFRNQYSIPHTLSLKWKQWPSNFFPFLAQVAHYLQWNYHYLQWKFKKILSAGKFLCKRP